LSCSRERLPLTASGQVLYRDEELTGLGLRVGTQCKVFFVEAQVARRTVRTTIGKYGLITPEQARRLALRTLGEMAQGVDPNAKRRTVNAQSITLRQAFARFFTEKPSLAGSSKSNYQRSVDLYLADWADRPIKDVTRAMVLHRHQQLSVERGAVTANYVMRHLRSVYNFIAAATEDLPPNPVVVLSQTRNWFPERRRQRMIQQYLLPQWYEAVVQEPPLARDYLLVAVFTGMRRREIASLRWEHIDLNGRMLTVPKTKNGDPLVLPLSSYLTRLLGERKQRTDGSPWVFPTGSAAGHLQECKSFVRRVEARSGIAFSLHDLRRTFITIAEGLDIPAYALKRLLNHRTAGDVTSGYIIMDVERLREPVERIADRIMALATQQVENGQGGSEVALQARRP
jgi:integrase